MKFSIYGITNVYYIKKPTYKTPVAKHLIFFFNTHFEKNSSKCVKFGTKSTHFKKNIFSMMQNNCSPSNITSN